MNPLISVIMPTYNPGTEIKFSIYSILKQTYRNLELIIVDDSDIEWFNKKEYTDKRIRYIKNNNKLGIIGSLNSGIKLSKGDYIARMDSDDIAHIRRLEYEYKYLVKNEDVDVVGCFVYVINNENKIRGTIGREVCDSEIKVKMLFNSPFTHPSILAKKAVIEKYMYDESFIISEDYDLWVRMMPDCKFHIIPMKLMKYRRGGTNLTAVQSRNSIINKEIYAKHITLQKSIYGRMIDYFSLYKIKQCHKYTELIYGQNVGEIPLSEKKELVRVVYAELKKTCDTKTSMYYASYLWLKDARYNFVKAPNFSIFICSCMVLLEILCQVITSRVYGLIHGNKRIYDWKLWFDEDVD